MDISREAATAKGPAETFIGVVWVDPITGACRRLAVLAARARWPAGPRWSASPRSSGRWACAPPRSKSQPLSTAAMCCRPGPLYVGRGGRTNGAGIRQLCALLAPLGLTAIAVPLRNGLHLKSAVTSLPDGTFLLLTQLVPAGLFPAVRPVPGRKRLPVVPLGGTGY